MNNIYEAIKQQCYLPLYYCADATVSLTILKTLYDSGVRVVEYTNRGDAALTNFEQMLKLRDAEMPDLILGIGTIKTIDDAKKFAVIGADFLISPCFDVQVSVFATENNITWIPGCMTPSEINQAEQKGIGFIKLFPGNVLKPAFVSAIKGLFPDIYFMPTGGVELDEENIASWFTAGVSAVGLGSKLISSKSIQNKDYATIQANVKKAIQIIQSIKK